MTDKVVELKTGRRSTDRLSDPVPWFPPLEARVGQIERMVSRLEWQIWLVLCGVAALVVLAVLEQAKLA